MGANRKREGVSGCWRRGKNWQERKEFEMEEGRERGKAIPHCPDKVETA